MTAPLTYVVLAPLVQLRRVDGSHVHVYQDAAIPPDADPQHVADLVRGGLVAEVETAHTAGRS